MVGKNICVENDKYVDTDCMVNVSEYFIINTSKYLVFTKKNNNKNDKNNNDDNAMCVS